MKDKYILDGVYLNITLTYAGKGVTGPALLRVNIRRLNLKNVTHTFSGEPFDYLWGYIFIFSVKLYGED